MLWPSVKTGSTLRLALGARRSYQLVGTCPRAWTSSWDSEMRPNVVQHPPKLPPLEFLFLPSNKKSCTFISWPTAPKVNGLELKLLALAVMLVRAGGRSVTPHNSQQVRTLWPVKFKYIKKIIDEYAHKLQHRKSVSGSCKSYWILHYSIY